MTDDLAADFRRLLLSIEATGHAVLPRTNEKLLQSIVEAAARIFGAGAASILLVNEADQTLEFVIATGETQKAVVGLTMPLDKGIAGYVAMTGQPIAVSKVQQDARFHAEVAIRTGYMPDSILAAPLLSGDRVIGVMEVLDKISAPAFGLDDIEMLGLFADQAALAIDQSRQFGRLGEALMAGLARLADGDPTAPEGMVERLGQAVADREGVADLLALADLFNAVSALGPAERKAALQVLRAFADYARSRPRFAR